MNYEHIIAYLFVLFILPKLLSKMRNKKAKRASGWNVLVAPVTILILGLGGIIIFSLIFFLDFTFTIAGDYMAAIFLPLMGLAGLYFVISYFRCFVHFNDTEIKYRPLFGKIVTIRWNDIKSVKYSKMMDQLVLESDTGKIRVDIQLSGYANFISSIKDNLPVSLYSEALKTDRALAKKRGYQ